MWHDRKQLTHATVLLEESKDCSALFLFPNDAPGWLGLRRRRRVSEGCSLLIPSRLGAIEGKLSEKAVGVGGRSPYETVVPILHSLYRHDLQVQSRRRRIGSSPGK